VISLFDIEAPDGNEIQWNKVPTSDTQVTHEENDNNHKEEEE
jgi:hypothetical protein